MKKIKQHDIAKMASVTDSFLSQVLSGSKRPSWKTAKRLAEATKTDPILWLEGTTVEIREAINDEKVNAA